MADHTNPTFSAARQPRGLVQVSTPSAPQWVTVPGWVDFSADSNTYYQADTWRCTFAASALPATFDINWWSRQKQALVRIFAGFPANPDKFTEGDLSQIIYGQVDDLSYDPAAGSLRLSGRDMAAAFIDAKTAEQWMNQTASQIATLLAQRHGLTPVVTATTAKVGSYYYGGDSVQVHTERSEWDILTFLAQQEEMVVYVRGGDLHFEPPTPEGSASYLLQWQPPTSAISYPSFNGVRIELSRAMNVAKGLVVVVQSINPKTKKVVTGRYPAGAKTIAPGKASPFGDTQIITRRIPNLTPEKAYAKAQALHREYTQHEVKLVATMPADNVLQGTSIIELSGTGTAFDQTYYPESVERTMSMNEGYNMTVRAKNHSPQSVVPQ